MSIGLPQITYTPSGGGPTTIPFVWGPQNFEPYFAGRVHDNLSTSGAVRERVSENLDILISFEMNHLVVDTTMPGFGAFMAFALAGGGFQFYPNASLPDYYNCVLEDTDWHTKRNAPKKYASTFVFRILNDAKCPSDPSVVLRRFYGVTA
jgi:hypothetical protein